MSMEKLHEVLLEIITNATFTPEALSRFQSTVARVKVLETELERVRYDRDEVKKVADEHIRRVQSYEQMENLLKLREEAVAKREAEMTKLETRVAVAEAKETVRKEVFDTLFRNPQVRRKSVDSVTESVSGPGGYSSNTRMHNIDETTEEA
jgi:hypothetical protein